MLYIVPVPISDITIYQVAFRVDTHPEGAFAAFTSQTVAENFMDWLSQFDTDGMIRRYHLDMNNDSDDWLHALILQRRKHVTFYDTHAHIQTYKELYPSKGLS